MTHNESKKIDEAKLHQSSNEFSVYQFFKDGSSERVRSFVSAEEAMGAFNHYTTNVASRMGITARVILTDGGDCIAMEWQHGKGIVFGLPSDQPSAGPQSGEPSDV
jgi:hypothetical protein